MKQSADYRPKYFKVYIYIPYILRNIMQKVKFPTIEIEIYKCFRCEGKPWAQRPEIDEDGRAILVRPKNCTHCKSPSWTKPRS